jgi:hypothetical protein
MRVAVLRSKTFSEATAAALDTAFQAWASEQGEAVFVSFQLTALGSDLILTVLYTR